MLWEHDGLRIRRVSVHVETPGNGTLCAQGSTQDAAKAQIYELDSHEPSVSSAPAVPASFLPRIIVDFVNDVKC